jgi:hypothetical protein
MNFNDYKDITLDMVLSKLKRLNPTLVPATSETTSKRPADSGASGRSQSDHKRPRTGNSGGSNFSSQGGQAPLSFGEKKFLESNIQKGGGVPVKENVQRKSEWINWAKREKVCIKCCGKGHFASDCKVGNSALNSMRMDEHDGDSENGSSQG